MMSGRMHRAICSISCCGIPESLTSFFLRAKWLSLPPIFQFLYIGFLRTVLLLAGMAPFLGETENADTCQAIAFSVSANISVSIFTDIIAKSVEAVKGRTAGYIPFECNGLGYNAVAAQWIFGLFITRKYKHTR